MSGDWVWVISPVNGLPHRLTNDPGVVRFHEARGYQLTDLPGELDSDDPDFVELLEKRQVGEANAELKGKALDEALEAAGLSKSGTVEEKRARLTEHEAAEVSTSEAEPAVEEEEEVDNG